MNKRRILAVLIALVLTIAATAMWSASTIQREGDPDAIVLEDSGSEAGVDQPKKKGGNKVVKVLAAPFKLFGKMFGGGDEQNKVYRMTEKDAEKFESAGITKIEDARNQSTRRDTSSASAREHLDAGREYLLEERYSDAISELCRALELMVPLREPIEGVVGLGIEDEHREGEEIGVIAVRMLTGEVDTVKLGSEVIPGRDARRVDDPAARVGDLERVTVDERHEPRRCDEHVPLVHDEADPRALTRANHSGARRSALRG